MPVRLVSYPLRGAKEKKEWPLQTALRLAAIT
jgi:hypothetical protein